MDDIYSNDPTLPMTGKQQQELAASLDSAGSAVPLRPSDLHTRTMVPRIREQIAKWFPQGPAAAGIPKTHGPLEKIERNQQREQPFQTFNPTLLSVSVST